MLKSAATFSLALVSCGPALDYDSALDCSFTSYGLCVRAEGGVHPQEISDVLRETEAQINKRRAGLQLEAELSRKQIVANLRLEWTHRKNGFITRGNEIFVRNQEDCYYTLHFIAHEVMHFVADVHYHATSKEDAEHDVPGLFIRYLDDHSAEMSVVNFLAEYCDDSKDKLPHGPSPEKV